MISWPTNMNWGVLLVVVAAAYKVGPVRAEPYFDTRPVVQFVGEDPASPSDLPHPRMRDGAEAVPRFEFSPEFGMEPSDWLADDQALPQRRRSRYSSLFDNLAYAGDGNRWTPSHRHMASIPSMFGHFYASGLTFIGFDGLIAFTDVPLAGGCGRTKVAENNKALTQDRAYIRYNHYHQALTADASQFIVGPDRRVFDLDICTVGAEFTFRDRLWSLEARMPFAGRMEFSTPNFSVAGGEIGNIALILKRMLYQSGNVSVAAGLGVDLPTGSSARGHVNLTEYRVRNDAVHLLPFAGFVYAPESPYFLQGFFQLDVPANGHRISTDDLIFGPSDSGVFTEQTLLHLDLALGRWLFRNPDAAWLTGMAFVGELHYMTTLNDTDLVADVGAMTLLIFTNSANHVDLLDFTIGLHTELRSNTLLRVGSVFPLRTGNDRSFDAELQVQLERRF